MRILRVLRGVAVLGLAMAGPVLADVKSGVTRWQGGDYKGAVAEWLPYAARGDADALFNLGQAYKLGRGVKADPAAAIDYFRKAANKGHTPAQERLGLILFGTLGSRSEAVRWLDLAARADQPRALYVMGVALFNGDGAPKDWPRAYGYMVRAAAKGVSQAATALVTMNSTIPIGDRAKGEQIASALASAKPATVMAASKPLPPLPTSAAPPAVAAASDPAAAPITSGWRVQVGAYLKQALAEDAWAKLKRDQATLLSTNTPVYQPAGQFTRLQIGTFPTRDAAKALCASLTAAGRACFVVAAN